MAWFVMQRDTAAGMFIELATQRGQAESACRSADLESSLLLASVALLHTALNACCADQQALSRSGTAKGATAGREPSDAVSQHEQCALYRPRAAAQ